MISKSTNLLGFNESEGQSIKYPIDFPVRKYQLDVVKDAVYNNSLVCLPTGMGKTFIAAVLMLNYHRWFPSKKLIFMAPTKPLVLQQMHACWSIVGLSDDKTVDMTGSLAPAKRATLWKKYNIFFLTPQILYNDISRGSCNPNDIILLIIDEAHHATGNYSYCQVIGSIHSVNTKFRILALTASPGSSIVGVQKIIDNLLVRSLHLYTNDHPEIIPYIHGREEEKIVVKLNQQILDLENELLKVINPILQKMIQNRAIYACDPRNLSKYKLLLSRDQFRQRLKPKLSPMLQGICESDFVILMKLSFSHELLLLHGFRSFCCSILDYINMPESGRIKKELLKYPNLIEQVHKINNLLESPLMITDPSLLPCHPKLTKLCEILMGHFSKYNNPLATRVIIFAQYRNTITDIVKRLEFYSPTISVIKFVGQSKSRGTGQNQKEQLDAVEKFKNGTYNVLISTSVGEEGLDIGNVDLIICFDASSSPLRLLQRIGRTGRRRTGKIVVLMTEGREENMHANAQKKAKSVSSGLQRQLNSLRYYGNNPRLLPLSANLPIEEITIKSESHIEVCDQAQTNIKKSPQIKTNDDIAYSDISDDFEECSHIKKYVINPNNTTLSFESGDGLFQDAVFDIYDNITNVPNTNNDDRIESKQDDSKYSPSTSSIETNYDISPPIVPLQKPNLCRNTLTNITSNIPIKYDCLYHQEDDNLIEIKRKRAVKHKMISSSSSASIVSLNEESNEEYSRKKVMKPRQFLLTQAEVEFSQNILSDDECDETKLKSSDSLNDFIVNTQEVHEESINCSKLFDTSLDMYQQSLAQHQLTTTRKLPLASPFENTKMSKSRMKTLIDRLERKYIEGIDDDNDNCISLISNVNDSLVEHTDTTLDVTEPNRKRRYSEIDLIDDQTDSLILLRSLHSDGLSDGLFEEQLGHISLKSSSSSTSKQLVQDSVQMMTESNSSLVDCIFVDSAACMSSYPSIGKLISLLRGKHEYTVIPVSKLYATFIINYDTIIEIVCNSDLTNKNILSRIHNNLTHDNVSDFHNRFLIVEKNSNEKNFDHFTFNKELARMMKSNIKIIHSPNTEYSLKIITDFNIAMKTSNDSLTHQNLHILQFMPTHLTDKNLKICEILSHFLGLNFVKTLNLMANMESLGNLFSAKSPSDILTKCQIITVNESRKIISVIHKKLL